MEFVQRIIDCHMLRGIDLKEYAEKDELRLSPQEEATIREYEDLAKLHSTKKITLLHCKEMSLTSGGGVFATAADKIFIPYHVRHASTDSSTEQGPNGTYMFTPHTNKSQNMGMFLHELGHIELNHYNERVRLLVLLYFLCFAGLVYNYTIGGNVMNIILVLYSCFFKYYVISQEYQADEFATHKGYGKILVENLKSFARYNSTHGGIFCTSSGDDLSDTTHPFLSSRIKNIQKVLDSRILSR